MRVGLGRPESAPANDVKAALKSFQGCRRTRLTNLNSRRLAAQKSLISFHREKTTSSGEMRQLSIEALRNHCKTCSPLQ